MEPILESGDKSSEEALDRKYTAIAVALTPENPIRSHQYLKGREATLEDVVRELRYFKSTPFVYGQRGVGKTSLATTAAILTSPAGIDPVYAACSPGCRLSAVLRNVCIDLLRIAIGQGKADIVNTRVDLNVSLNPSIKLSFEKKIPIVEEFATISGAFLMLRDLNDLIDGSEKVVVIIDELEELEESDRGDLAFIVKQLGDQEIGIRFMLVGIAENVHELIGAHQSVPRYIKEVSLEPLNAQVLLEIVKDAAIEVDISIRNDFLYRIAIIGNGFPHFAHLMGKHILSEAVAADSIEVTSQIYSAGVKAAVNGSIQELRIAYEQATQRPEEYNKHLLWALAHDDVIDISTAKWRENYEEMCSKYHWAPATNSHVTNALSNLKKSTYGKVVINTPTRYGKSVSRRSFRRFRDPLMRGHVRLQAEYENFQLGSEPSVKLL